MFNSEFIKKTILTKIKKQYPGINEIVIQVDESGKGYLSLEGQKHNYQHEDTTLLQLAKSQIKGDFKGVYLYINVSLNAISIKIYYTFDNQNLFKELKF